MSNNFVFHEDRNSNSNKTIKTKTLSKIVLLSFSTLLSAGFVMVKNAVIKIKNKILSEEIWDINKICVKNTKRFVEFNFNTGVQVRMRDSVDKTYEDTPTPNSLIDYITTDAKENMTTPPRGELC